jgi:hypothetical protein
MFSGNWLDIPFPNTNKISMLSHQTLMDIERELPDDNYNWIELLKISNDMIIEEERIWDIGFGEFSSDGNNIRCWYNS